jgi:acyl-CoA reductase-like NAD-dependent aldehyde dehydrogenase
MIERPYYLAGRPEAPNHDLLVRDKASGEVYAKVAQADDATLDRAIEAAVAAAPAMKALPAYVRQQILEHCVRRFSERAEELALGLCIEAGKPIKDARGEVTRLDRHLPPRRRVKRCGSRARCWIWTSARGPKGYRGIVQAGAGRCRCR